MRGGWEVANPSWICPESGSRTSGSESRTDWLLVLKYKYTYQIDRRDSPNFQKNGFDVLDPGQIPGRNGFRAEFPYCIQDVLDPVQKINRKSVLGSFGSLRRYLVLMTMETRVGCQK